MGTVTERTIEIDARDGTPIAGACFAPDTITGPTTVLLPAMGVPRRFYDRFARYLAESGHRVLSTDYRGMGASAPERLRGYEAEITDWAQLDVAGLIDHALETHAPASLVFAGHSLAGQLFGLVPNKDAVDRMLTVASVKGHWRMWEGTRAARLWTLSHVLVPVLARSLGYLPARWIGLGGEDLPRDAALEWARWIRHPDYVVDADGEHPAQRYASYEGHMLAISLADDWYAPAQAVEALLGMYPNARTEHRHIAPGELGLDEIGHFGFFRPACRPLWDQAAAWLAGASSDPGEPGRKKKGRSEQRAREDEV